MSTPYYGLKLLLPTSLVVVISSYVSVTLCLYVPDYKCTCTYVCMHTYISVYFDLHIHSNFNVDRTADITDTVV